MLAWQIAAYSALALLTTLLLLWPVWRQRQRLGRIEAELAVCRAQLEEIARDRELGLVDEDAARAAETEIKRRMLAIAGENEREEDGGKRPLRSLAVASALLVPIAGAAFYLHLGRPDLPDMPLASRDDLPGRETRIAGGDGAGGLPNVEEMVARLEERLAREPEDVDGWLMLARSNIVLGRYAGAARAYQQAEKLSPELPGVAGALGEALTLAAQGVVTPAAKEAFEREFERNPRDPRARFYIGLAYEQAGEFDKALSAYLELGRDSTADAPWLPQLRSRIMAVAEELDADVEPLLAEVGTRSSAEEADRLARSLEEDPRDWQGWMELVRLRVASGDAEAATAALARAREIFAEAPFVQDRFADLAVELGLEEPPDAEGAPSREAVAAASRMSPEEQRAMIAGMVDRLAARLERQPDDLEGWRMLARSYRVLGRREEAAEAYGRLARALPEDVEAQLDYALALLETVPAQEPLPDPVITAFETVNALDADQPDALFYLGLAAAQRGETARARELWSRLLAMLPAGTPQYEEVKKQLDSLDS